MSVRPALEVTAPDFGMWLKTKRGKLSLAQLAMKIRPLVIESGQKVSTSTLKRFEDGRVPNWPILLAYAVVFKTPVSILLTRLARNLEFPGSRELAVRRVVYIRRHRTNRGLTNMTLRLVSENSKNGYSPTNTSSNSPTISASNSLRRPPLAKKAARLQALSPGAASVIERLIDNILDELEGRRP
jgi:hypothetical protein